MHFRAFLLLLAAGLMLGLVPPASTPPAGHVAIHARGVSIVPLHPSVTEKMRAEGRRFRDPFPNRANQGRKFNPVGGTVGQLVTDPTQNVLVIFVKFQTPPPGGPDVPIDLAYFDNMLFGAVYDPPEYAGYAGHPTDRTLANYYSEVSYGNVHVVTLNMPSALGWAESEHSYEYYCQPDGEHDYGFGPYPRNAQGMVIEAIKLVDPFVDFSTYAGGDGVVPNLFVVHTGTGAEWSTDPSLIWSHSWNIADGTGSDYANGYLTDDGATIINYATMPEVGGDLTGFYSTPPPDPYPPTVGVYAHEYGHVLGLPDQYDYGYESDGTGIYSLMAGGSWNSYPASPAIFSGNSPAHLDAWSKYRLGFVTPTVVTSAIDVTLRPAERWPDIYKMVVPNSGGKEYFLLENRQQVGFDEGLAVYGLAPGTWGPKGLAIYHVDETVLWRTYWNPNEAENWKEFRSEGWRKAWTGETHYGVSVIQADDRWEFERGTYWRGAYSNDLYPGMDGLLTRFASNTLPNSSNYYFWAGSEPKFGYSGATVEAITQVGEDITATLSFVPWTPGKK